MFKLYNNIDISLDINHERIISYHVNILRDITRNGNFIMEISRKYLKDYNQQLTVEELNNIHKILQKYQYTIYNKNHLVVNDFINKREVFNVNNYNFSLKLDRNLNKLMIYSNNNAIDFIQNIEKYIDIVQITNKEFIKIREKNIACQIEIINIILAKGNYTKQEYLNKIGLLLNKFNSKQKKFLNDNKELKNKLIQNNLEIQKKLYDDMHNRINKNLFKTIKDLLFKTKKKLHYIHTDMIKD